MLNCQLYLDPMQNVNPNLIHAVAALNSWQGCCKESINEAVALVSYVRTNDDLGQNQSHETSTAAAEEVFFYFLSIIQIVSQ